MRSKRRRRSVRHQAREAHRACGPIARSRVGRATGSTAAPVAQDRAVRGGQSRFWFGVSQPRALASAESAFDVGEARRAIVRPRGGRRPSRDSSRCRTTRQEARECTTKRGFGTGNVPKKHLFGTVPTNTLKTRRKRWIGGEACRATSIPVGAGGTITMGEYMFLRSGSNEACWQHRSAEHPD